MDDRELEIDLKVTLEALDYRTNEMQALATDYLALSNKNEKMNVELTQVVQERDQLKEREKDETNEQSNMENKELMASYMQACLKWLNKQEKEILGRNGILEKKLEESKVMRANEEREHIAQIQALKEQISQLTKQLDASQRDLERVHQNDLTKEKSNELMENKQNNTQQKDSADIWQRSFQTNTTTRTMEEDKNLLLEWIEEYKRKMEKSEESKQEMCKESSRYERVLDKPDSGSDSESNLESREEYILGNLPLSSNEMKRRITEEVSKDYKRAQRVQHLDYSNVDKRALNCPKSKKKSPRILTEYLIAGLSNYIMKARIIWRWITAHISYDTKSYFSESYNSCAPRDVLYTGKSVCSGYARLFKEMCDIAGVECVKISGWAKGHRHKVGESFENQSTNHAWNAIRVDGNWYLLDATWGAGHVDNHGQFQRSYKESYWLTSPYIMIGAHFPSDKEWQLLKTPFSMNKYSQMVYARPRFYELGLRIISHTKSVINSAQGKATVIFLCTKPNIKFLAHLYHANGTEAKNAVNVSNNTSQETVHISLLIPKKGRYSLNIFAKEGNKGKESYDSIIKYQIESEVGLGGGFIFPYVYSIKEGELLGPLLGILNRGEKYEFKVFSKQAVAVALTFSSTDWRKLTRGAGHVWYLSTNIPRCARGDCSLNLKFPGRGARSSYSTLCEYNIQ